MKLRIRNRTIEFPRRPMVMGIINLGADSFSGDSILDVNAAFERALRFIAEGAEIIDIGAESARTNRTAMSEQEEIDRLCAFVEMWNSEFGIGNDFSNSALRISHSALLSVNTWRPAVARAALVIGGDILNDLSALPTDDNARICAEHGAALLIMHSVGEPKIAHTHIGYDDVMQTLDEFFTEKIALAVSAGLSREAIILDPGIDFAKQRDDNLRIYREMERLQKFDRPLLLPVSRKTVVGEVLGIADPRERDAGTIACIVSGMQRGASIFRVHNVRAAVQTINMIAAVETQR